MWQLSETLSLVRVFAVLMQWIIQMGMRSDPFGQPLLYGLYGVVLGCRPKSDGKSCVKSEKESLKEEFKPCVTFTPLNTWPIAVWSVEWDCRIVENTVECSPLILMSEKGVSEAFRQALDLKAPPWAITVTVEWSFSFSSPLIKA